MTETIIVCATVLAFLGAGYDIARRVIDRANRSALDALQRKIEALEDSNRAHVSMFGSHSQQLDLLRNNLVELRDHNTEEHAAMKTAFDRFTAKDAVAAFHSQGGRNWQPG